MVLEQWGIPRFAYQYLQGPAEQKVIASLVEDAVKQAEQRVSTSSSALTSVVW